MTAYYKNLSRLVYITLFTFQFFILQSCDESETCPKPVYYTVNKSFKNKVNYKFGQRISFLHTDSASATSDTIHLTVADTSSLFYTMYEPNYPECVSDLYEHKRYLFNPGDKNQLETGILYGDYSSTSFYIKFRDIDILIDIGSISNDPNFVSTFIRNNNGKLASNIKVLYSVSKGIIVIEALSKNEKWTLIQ